MQDPFIGTWKMNLEKSEFGTHPRPLGGTIVYEIDSEGYYLRNAEGIGPNGNKVVERPERFLADGIARAVPDFPGLKCVVRRTDPNSLSAEVAREDGSLVGGGTSVVSADGKSLTIDNFGYDSQLRQFKVRVVCDHE